MVSFYGLAAFQFSFQQLFNYFALCRRQIICLVFVIDGKKPKLITT